MRLEQILFSQGFGTRHECRGLIALGQVTVKGEVVDDPDADIDVESLTLRSRAKRGRIGKRLS